MPPTVALLLCISLVLVLVCFDPTRDRKVSGALWVPIIFMFFMGSRQPTQWLSGNIATGGVGAAAALMDGDPLNRTVSSVLLFMGVAILMSRSFRWGEFFAR